MESVPAGFSSQREHFVAHEMETNASRFGAIEVARFHRFPDVGSELVPGIALGENAFRQALGRKATIRILRDFKDDS